MEAALPRSTLSLLERLSEHHKCVFREEVLARLSVKDRLFLARTSHELRAAVLTSGLPIVGDGRRRVTMYRDGVHSIACGPLRVFQYCIAQGCPWLSPHTPELASLADAAEVRVVGRLMQQREHPRARTYLGKGKVEELATMVQALSAKVVIFDNDLSPMQIKSLEEDLKCKVLDRSELILDIFANRAATKEARLQVEIAQLEYTAPRLRAMCSHLGQVTGGAPIGVGTRGPGEQQLEVDVLEQHVFAAGPAVREAEVAELER